MVSTISCTIRDPELLPTIRGINCVYGNALIRRQVARRQSEKGNNAMLSFALGLRIEDIFLTGDEVYNHFNLLSHPMELFTGYGCHDGYTPKNNEGNLNEICTAEVQGGLCYYLDCLRRLSSHAETARLVHIVPGHIQMDDRQYIKIYDTSSGNVERPWAPVESEVINLEDNLLAPKPRLYQVTVKPKAIATANDNELIAYYEASANGETPYRIRPGRLTCEILKRTGAIACNKNDCGPNLAFPCSLVRQGWQRHGSQDKDKSTRSGIEPECFVWPQMSDIARCVAFQKSRSGSSGIFLRRSECLACCTTSVLRSQLTGTGLYHIM